MNAALCNCIDDSVVGALLLPHVVFEWFIFGILMIIGRFCTLTSQDLNDVREQLVDLAESLA